MFAAPPVNAGATDKKARPAVAFEILAPDEAG
jgi:hypothetical protein